MVGRLQFSRVHFVTEVKVIFGHHYLGSQMLYLMTRKKLFHTLHVGMFSLGIQVKFISLSASTQKLTVIVVLLQPMLLSNIKVEEVIESEVKRNGSFKNTINRLATGMYPFWPVRY